MWTGAGKSEIGSLERKTNKTKRREDKGENKKAEKSTIIYSSSAVKNLPMARAAIEEEALDNIWYIVDFCFESLFLFEL